MHLTFWQPIPSPHQRGFLEALASAPWVKSVRLRYESPLSDERRAQGWEDVEFVGVDVAPISLGETPKSGSDQVNIFTGFNTHPGVWSVFQRIPSGAPGLCLVYAEAPELRGLAGLGRALKYRLAAQRLKGRVHGVLALGDLGADFYRKLLGANVPVTPFAYYDRSERDRVVEPQPEAGAPNAEDGGRKTEDGGSKPEALELKAEDGGQKPDDGGQKTEDGERKPEDGGRGSELSGLDFAPTNPLPLPVGLPSNANLVVNGLSLQAGSLSLSPSGSTSPGFDLQLSGLQQPASVSPTSGLSSPVPTPTAPSGLRSVPSPAQGAPGSVTPSPTLRGESLHDSPSPRGSASSGLSPPVSSAPPIPPRHVAPMLGKIGAVHSNTRRLLFVGQCIWRKGLDQLLVALAAMPPSTPPWVLDVVGTGTEVGVFMHLAEKLDLVDRVRFRGMIKGAPLDQFYLRADLVLVPSRWDGWGMAVNEALFAGVPVAATDCCGASSVIKDLPRCMVLPAKRTEEWPEYLSEWLEWGGAMKSDRARLQKAAESLTGEAGVELLKKTLEQARKRS